MAKAAPPAASMDPAAMAALAAAAELNTNLSALFVLAQIILVSFFFIGIAPLLAWHVTAGRLWQGWSLRRNTRPFFVGNNRDSIMACVEGPRVPEGSALPMPSGGVWVWTRNAYNKMLLRPSLVVDLTMGQVLVLMIYSGLLVAASVYKVGGWAVNPTRFGYVAIAQVPATFILAMKNNPLSIIGKGYEKLNFLHRFAGRMFLLFGLVHGSYFYHMEIELFGSISLTGSTLTGTVAIIAIGVMFLSGLKPIRQRLYQTFLTLHILGYLTTIVALWCHKPATQPFLIAGISALGADHLFKFINTRVRSATFTSLPGGLTKIEVDRVGTGWRAGQHVWIRVFSNGNALQKHPFTIANAPASTSSRTSTRSLVLVAKAAGDFTNSLHRIAGVDTVMSVDNEKGGMTSDARLAVFVEGPYGGMGYLYLADHESVVLFAGGSGFTFVMASLEEIVGLKVKGKAVTNHILVLWTLRDLGMVEAFADSISLALRTAKRINLDIAFRVHVTKALGGFTEWPIPELRVVQSRPNISLALSETVDLTIADVNARGATRGAGVVLGVCGTASLVKSCRLAVAAIDGGRAAQAGGVTMHSEMFGW